VLTAVTVSIFSNVTPVVRVLVGKPEGQRPLRSSRCRWEDNIKMDLKEVGWEDVDLIYLAQVMDKW
jgi:hypothetical protein